MVKINTLIKKVYLLAGVIMAANMFVVNEVRASDQECINSNINNDSGNNNEKDDDYYSHNNNGNNTRSKSRKRSSLNLEKVTKEIQFFLYLEDYFNFLGTFALSSVNNYFKLWNYDVGRYWSLGCFGWRSGRFLNDICQFDVNINLGRGIFWLIPGFLYFLKENPTECNTNASIPIKIVYYLFFLHKTKEEEIKTSYNKARYYRLVFSILQGFISMPLTVHISKFSISISLDSIFWMLVGIYTHNKITKLESNNGIGERKDEIESFDNI